MIDWIKTAQGVAAIVAAICATMVAWWNLGLPRSCSRPSWRRSRRGRRLPQGRQLHPVQPQRRLLLVPVRPDNRLQYDIAGTLYNKDAGPK